MTVYDPTTTTDDIFEAVTRWLFDVPFDWAYNLPLWGRLLLLMVFPLAMITLALWSLIVGFGGIILILLVSLRRIVGNLVKGHS